MTFRPIVRNDTEEAWRQQIQNNLNQTHDDTLQFFHNLSKLIKVRKF